MGDEELSEYQVAVLERIDTAVQLGVVALALLLALVAVQTVRALRS